MNPLNIHTAMYCIAALSDDICSRKCYAIKVILAQYAARHSQQECKWFNAKDPTGLKAKTHPR